MKDRISVDEYRKLKGLPALGDQVALPATHSKHPRQSSSKPAVQAKEDHSRVYGIRLHCRRRGSTDVGGASHKAAVDGMVQAGILPDDCRDYQPLEPIYTEQKCKSGEECTLVEVRGFKNIAGLVGWYKGGIHSLLDEISDAD